LKGKYNEKKHYLGAWIFQIHAPMAFGSILIQIQVPLNGIFFAIKNFFQKTS